MPQEMRYEATFHPVYGGTDMTLRLDSPDYHQLNTGMLGMLQVKGTRFIGFAPQQA
nr:DUF2500 family protein [Brenneria rubrifaciens]